jgi:hypothetical protein
LAASAIGGILTFVKHRHNETANREARELLLAEMVYKTAVEKHRQEQTEVSRRVVAEAYRQYMDTQRDVMVAAWDTSARVVSCPRCRRPALATRWREGDDDGRRSEVPEWARKYTDGGARSVTRYTCGDCGFEVALVE